MVRDALTVMWKEWRDMPIWRGGLKGGILSQLVFIGIFGIMIPMQSGRAYLDNLTAPFFALWVPLMSTIALVADTFAGERERHTLETLLASRLSDRSILFGKLGTVVAYAWGLTIAMLVLPMITVNIAYGQGKLLTYSASVGIGAPLLGLLTALFMSGLGVIVSLRASTVRQATQTLSMGFIALFLLSMLGPMLPKQWIEGLVRWYTGVGPGGLVARLTATLLVLDAVLLRFAIARFQRSKLIFGLTRSIHDAHEGPHAVTLSASEGSQRNAMITPPFDARVCEATR